MKRWLIGTMLFVVGLAIGACLRGSQTAFAQTQTKAIVQAVPAAATEAFGEPKTPPTDVNGKVVGFSCMSDHCFVLVER